MIIPEDDLEKELIQSKFESIEFGSPPHACPCCDNILSTVAVNVIGFDYFKGIVFNHKKRMFLEEREADLLYLLLKKWPKLLSVELILRGLYGLKYYDLELQDENATVVVYLSKLRKKLRPFEIDVQNVPRRGWWLIKEGMEARTPT